MHIATLIAGDYVFGAAALVNSLARAGFTGQITVGHQGPVNWQIQPGAPIVMRELDDSQTWGGSLKGNLLLSLGDGDVCYIDADCIVTSPQLFELIFGVIDEQPLFAVEAIVPASDVRRRVWTRSILGSNDRVSRYADLTCMAYLNAGFFALRLPRDNLFLKQYQQAIERCLIGTGRLFETPYFPMGDQDCMNAVLSNLDIPFATIGPPDVWYRAQTVNPYLHVGAATDPVLLHCTGKLKPWQLNRPMISGPDVYDKWFYHFAFLETPWVQMSQRMPRALEGWFQDNRRSRISRRARRIKDQIVRIIDMPQRQTGNQK